MDKKSLVEKIIGLNRYQKEYFVNNFNNIKDVLKKEAKFCSFIKKAEDENISINDLVIESLIAGLRSDPQAMAIARSFIQNGGKTDQNIDLIFENAFSSGYEISGFDPEAQEFVLEHMRDIIQYNRDAFIKEIELKISPSKSLAKHEQYNEEPVFDEEVKEQNRSFSSVFGVNESEVEFIDSGKNMRYAVYRGVINIPVDNENNVVLKNEDVNFIKKTIDSYMIGFFNEGDGAPFRPDSGIAYSPEDKPMDERVRDLRINKNEDPLTSRYKGFFEDKSKYFDSTRRTETLSLNFENRIIEVYNEITGSSEVSYTALIEKYKRKELDLNFNTIRHIVTSVRKRIYGQDLSPENIETLGSYAKRTQQDKELFADLMGVKAIDDLSGDYIGKMQKLYIGDKIGQETHDRVMELGDLVFGSSIGIDGTAAKNDITLSDLVSGKVSVSGIAIPYSILKLKRYSKNEDLSNLPYSEIPAEIQDLYRSDVAKKINEVKSAFSANNISDPETIDSFMRRIYSPESYAYYKHTAEITRHYQIQSELSRLGSRANNSNNAVWCSRCGHFRPSYDPRGGKYITYKVGEGKNSQIKRTYNIPPSSDYDKLSVLKAKGYEILEYMPGTPADDPITEYEEALLSPEALAIVKNNSCIGSGTKCDYATDFYPNLLRQVSEINTEGQEFMGFVPLRFMGKDIEKIPAEVITGKYMNANGKIKSKKEGYSQAKFPPYFEETLTKLHGQIISSWGGQISPAEIDTITRDLMDTVSLIASEVDIQNSALLLEEENQDHPLNSYYKSAENVRDYFGRIIKNDPEERQKFSNLIQTLQSIPGSEVDEENLLMLESLRKFCLTFGYDSYTPSFMRRMNSNLDVAKIEKNARKEAGIEDVNVHAMLFNDRIGDIPTNDLALLSSIGFLEANEDVQRLIRQLVIHKYMPEYDASEIGRLYTKDDAHGNVENDTIDRDDNYIANKIFEIMKAKSIRIPRPDRILKELYTNDPKATTEDFKALYRKYIYDYSHEIFEDKFDPERNTPKVDLYLYDAPMELVSKIVYDLIGEYRQLYRGMASFLQPLKNVNKSKWGGFYDKDGKTIGSLASPSQTRKELATKLSLPWSSANESDPEETFKEKTPGKVYVPKEPTHAYKNVSWLKEVYRRSKEANPTAESVAAKYLEEAGISNKEIIDPALDLALLEFTKLEDATIKFEKPPEDIKLRRQLEIELMKQSLREELLQIYLLAQKKQGLQAFKGISRRTPKDGSSIQKEIIEEENTIVLIAATILGRDPRAYTDKNAPDYEEIKHGPVYKMVSDLIHTPKDNMLDMFKELAKGEAPYQFLPKISPEYKTTFREQHKKFRGGNMPHLTAAHDTLIKYLISPDNISHSILEDLYKGADYLDAATRMLISRLIVGASQGPNSQIPPASVAYHIQNASTGHFEPGQQQHSFYSNSNKESPAFLKMLIGGRNVKFPIGDIKEIIDMSGGRISHSSNDPENAQQSSEVSKKKNKQRKEYDSDKTSSTLKWYKKSQVESVNPEKKSLIIENILFYSDRDLLTSFRNRLYRSGPEFVNNANLPKMFMRPFSDFGSLDSLNKFCKATGFIAVPITPEAKALAIKMKLRLPE